MSGPTGRTRAQLPRIDAIIEKVRKYNPSTDEKLLQRAYLFSAFAHEGQVRWSGEPYLVHPVAVADILADLKADDIALVAGLLHDVVEDNLSVKLDGIESRFGREVAHIVDGVTKIEEKLPYASKEEKEWASLRKIVLAMVDDIRVILVKLADRLHNMRTMEALPEQKRALKARETLEIYAPVAYRLGLGKMKTELEDLGFRYAYPKEYEKIHGSISHRRQVRGDFLDTTQGLLDGVLKDVGVRGEVQGRIKHYYSIYKKLVRQRIQVEQIYDYMAFRVLVGTEKDCYAVLGGIHGLWKPIPGRFKDWIALPKENRYRSLHTSIIGPEGQVIEIQIRTFQMHEEAENGIAAHWKYKEGRLSPEDQEQTMEWLRQILDWRQDGASAGEFVQNLKVDLYPNEVYVFTPAGKVLSLPRGATPVDFAYAIHSEVGHRCTGAKVNNKLVPLKNPLRSGDRVEILTSPSARPSRDWLDYAVTSRALNKIRAFLKAHEKARAIEIGKNALDRECKRLHVNLKAAQESGLLAEALKKASVPEMDSLHAEIGYGKISPRIFARRLMPAKEEAGAALAIGASTTAGPPILVRGADDVLTVLARCCKPIRGDRVVGFISRGKGLVVHRRDCVNLRKAKTERMMEVEWGGASASSALQEARITVLTEDRTGIMATITMALAEAKASIRKFDAVVNPHGEGEFRITLSIRDRGHLTTILGQLKKIPGVFAAKRVGG
jgi:GTP pyrophosphokinase